MLRYIFSFHRGQLGVCELEGSQGNQSSLKAIYRAEAAAIALTRLEEFEAEWGKRYPANGQL